jgi:hypothetical protein
MMEWRKNRLNDELIDELSIIPVIQHSINPRSGRNAKERARAGRLISETLIYRAGGLIGRIRARVFTGSTTINAPVSSFSWNCFSAWMMSVAA